MPGPNETQVTTRPEAEIEAELLSLDQIEDDLDAGSTDGTAQTSGESDEPAARDYEAEAKRKGWKPKDKFAGTTGEWVDAKTFVERGDKFVGNLQREIARLNAKVDEVARTAAMADKLYKDVIARKDAEHSEAIRNLRLQKAAAVREGDDAAVVELEDRIELVQQQHQEARTELQAAATEKKDEIKGIPQEIDVDEVTRANPVLAEWVEDGNSWFKSDGQLRAYALAVADGMVKAGEKTKGRKFLDLVAEQVRADFPRKFREQSSTTQRQSTAESGSRGGGSGSDTGGKTMRDVAPADRALARQFIKDGLYTEASFLKSYFAR